MKIKGLSKIARQYSAILFRFSGDHGEKARAGILFGKILAF